MSAANERPSLSFTYSRKNIQKDIPVKKLVYDTGYNNSEVLKRRYTKSLKDELNNILHTQELCKVFKRWLKEHKSEENLYFWMDVEVFRNSKAEGAALKQKALALYEKYWGEDVNSLNIDGSTLEELRESLAKPEVSITVFDTVQRNVFTLMETGCVSRFLHSPQYKQWLESQREEAEVKVQEREKPKLRPNSKSFAVRDSRIAHLLKTRHSSLSLSNEQLERFFQSIGIQQEKKSSES